MVKCQVHLFSVTRQLQWPDGTKVVEINQGGFDFANPSMMGIKFRKEGEGETFEGMTPAVDAGIKVYKAWKAAEPDAEIGIAVGYTGGNTMPFDGQELTDELEAELLDRAKSNDENLERCAHCGEILGDERFGMPYMHRSEFDCCSSNCAEMHYLEEPEEEEEDPDDDEWDDEEC